MNESISPSEVISAFLDNEPFDAGELSAALADPVGRALLIDLIALRGLAQTADPAATVTSPPARRWRRLAAVVALPVALGAGYGAGWFVAAARVDPGDERPPAATRVITDLEWQGSKGGK